LRTFSTASDYVWGGYLEPVVGKLHIDGFFIWELGGMERRVTYRLMPGKIPGVHQYIWTWEAFKVSSYDEA